MDNILKIANDYYLIFFIVGIIMLLALIGYLSNYFHQRSFISIKEDKNIESDTDKKEDLTEEKEKPKFAFEEK